MFEKTICKKELTLVSLCIHSNVNGIERLVQMRTDEIETLNVWETGKTDNI